MAAEFSLTSFAALTTSMIFEVDHAQHKALEEAAKIVEEEAKRVIGTYDYGWTPLAASTKADRVHKGFPADEPLLRTGAMRDSIEHKVISSREAAIGSNNDIAVYQELGTSKIPPRSFLVQAAIHKEADVAHEIGRHTLRALLP